MKTLYPEDFLPGWAMPSAAVHLSVWCAEFAYLSRRKPHESLYFSSIKMKAFWSERGYDMPRKQNSSGKANSGKFEAPKKREAVRWINVNLDDDDGARLSEQDYTLDSLAAGFLALCLEGWDVSLKRHGVDGSIMATAIIDDPHNDSGRVGLSGWSDNFPDAIASLLYKIEFKLDGGLPTPSDTPKRRFR
jgi:hypothetical protein